MDFTPVIPILEAVIVGGSLIVLGMLFVRGIDRIRPNNPIQKVILDEARLWAHKAYAAGITILATTDKTIAAGLSDHEAIRAVAIKYYAFVPQAVKVFVTLDMWESLVLSVADEIEAQVTQNATWLTGQLGMAAAATSTMPKTIIATVQPQVDPAGQG